jgi:hypothetical protein
MLKMKSLRTFHIAHNKADTPTLMSLLSFFATPFSQFPNKYAALDGGGKLKVIKLILQRIFAKGHENKRCCNDHKTSLKAAMPRSFDKIIFS